MATTSPSAEAVTIPMEVFDALRAAARKVATGVLDRGLLTSERDRAVEVIDLRGDAERLVRAIRLAEAKASAR
jgi:hypothetical protein